MEADERAVLPPGFKLRRATLRDLRAAHRLQQVIFPRDAYTTFDLALLFLWPPVINVKISAADGGMAAFLSCVRSWQSVDNAWIITIGVHPAYQQRGLATYLLAFGERRLGRPCVCLTVRESNLPAIKLYKKTGYEVVRRQPGYYHDGEAGLVMEKEVGA